jgi:DNA processing protein
VVVVEAALRSGSLITARIAQDLGREVFAVPGSPLDPRARGANELLRQGAVLVETAEDVLRELPEGAIPGPVCTYVGEPPISGENAVEPQPADTTGAREAVLELLSAAPTIVDDLVRRCQFSSSAVMAALLELELAGRVQALPGSRVALLPGLAP